MSAQTLPTGPYGPTPSLVTISGSPTRGQVTFSLNQASPSFSQASLWAQTATNYVGYLQNVLLMRLNLKAGQTTITEALELIGSYQYLFADLDIIDPSQSIAASMTLVV